MNDTELVSTWSALEPSARRRARIETRVFEWLEASETSLADEWLGLLKMAPLTGLAYVSVGAISQNSLHRTPPSRHEPNADFSSLPL
jgi:hypothetical protein